MDRRPTEKLTDNLTLAAKMQHERAAIDMVRQSTHTTLNRHAAPSNKASKVMGSHSALDSSVQYKKAAGRPSGFTGNLALSGRESFKPT